MIIQKVKAVQDDSGHWYIIPNDLLEEFHRELSAQRSEVQSLLPQLKRLYPIRYKLNKTNQTIPYKV